MHAAQPPEFLVNFAIEVARKDVNLKVMVKNHKHESDDMHYCCTVS